MLLLALSYDLALQTWIDLEELRRYFSMCKVSLSVTRLGINQVLFCCNHPLKERVIAHKYRKDNDTDTSHSMHLISSLALYA
jgi:hypothetical protein